MVKKLVSIIIPVYNGSNYVAEAVESALNQTYENVEVIVVNDGSDDNGKTREVLKRYDNRIKYIEKENGGVASALNEGIRNMSGDYFAWLSHDDIFDNNKIKIQVEDIEKSGDSQCISAMNYIFFDEESKAEIATDFQKYYPINRIEKSIFILLWGELHFSSLLFHKDHFKRVGLFNENLLTAQDNDFLFRLLRGQRIVFNTNYASRVRLHKESGTSTNKDILNAENSRMYEMLLNQLSEKELEEIGGTAKRTRDKIKSIITSMSPIRDDLPELIDGRDENIVLVGAGGYGRRVNYELRANGIRPLLFLDNDRSKEGKIIDGVLCKKLCKENIPENATIIVTNKFYKTLEKILETYGEKNIINKYDFDRQMINK
ncbi:glycosyltransferase [Pseudobutyrivibrio ruminis]|uniref:Glycosyltransferase involved in cell wall bisynthesis n=1 Tax=Pseudobutyrivibrio ruminis DSM 9787 TaxID=1123011 RepID=A0A285RVG8_9FIRM|nr:glycosyltransferase [Pseudobutyrivibrio ruminis]SOB98399.1 Glycosyltransferase involved in cell wall bisynthesis [Pseudobutyrivibrio ruminis DSM 9787]